MGIVFIILFVLFIVGFLAGFNILDVLLVGPFLFTILAVLVAMIVIMVASGNRSNRRR